MNKSIFTSKKQFHNLSQLVSKTFDIKESKVEHKLSQSLRYKNANALIADLPKGQTETQANHFSFLEDIIDLEADILAEECVFQKNENNEFGIKIDTFFVPRFVSFFKDKIISHDIDFLRQVAWMDDFDFSQEEKSVLRSDCFIFSDKEHLSADRTIFYSTLQHLFSGYVFDDELLSIFSFNQLKELITYCSIEQFNVICSAFDSLFSCDKKEVQDKLKRKIGLQLNIRYFETLNKIQDGLVEYNDPDYLPHAILANIMFSENHDSIESMINISTPPLGYIMESEIKERCYEGSSIEHFGEVLFANTDLDKTTVVDAFKNIIAQNKKEFDRCEYAIIRHLTFAFESGLKSFIEDEDKREEFQLNDLTCIYEIICEYLSDDVCQRFLAIRPDNSIYNRYYKFDENTSDWDGISVFEATLINGIDSFLFDLQRSYSKINEIKPLLKHYFFDNVMQSLFKDKASMSEAFKFSELDKRKEFEFRILAEKDMAMHDKVVELFNKLSAPQMTNGDALKAFLSFKNKL